MKESMKIGRMRSEKGFTLIEIVSVVVLLGVLGVFLLPRVVSLTDDAERTVFIGFYKAFEAAINQSHLKWQASGRDNTITVDGAPITVNANGYPVSPFFGLGGCQQLWNDMLEDAPPTAFFNNSNFEWTIFPLGANCIFIHQNNRPFSNATSRWFWYIPTTNPPTFIPVNL